MFINTGAKFEATRSGFTLLEMRLQFFLRAGITRPFPYLQKQSLSIIYEQIGEMHQNANYTMHLLLKTMQAGESP